MTMCPKICQFVPSERSARVFATLVPFPVVFSTLFSMYDVCFYSLVFLYADARCYFLIPFRHCAHFFPPFPF